MLESFEVTKKFLGKTAVDSISLKLEPGHIYAMLGPNGSGKTTWMKMAAGLIKPTSGVIKYNNVPVNVESRKHIAYMSTEPYFYDWMTIGDVGNYYDDFFEDFSMEAFDEMLVEMKLEKNLKCKALSSGMLAKLKVAVTMARDAKVYMLDEPLNGIDLLARDEVLNAIIRHAGEDKILLVSSHLVEELESVVDYAIFINNSHLVDVYEVEELRVKQCVSLADKYRDIYGSAEIGGAC
ncbi:ABC transporter ATP-binding protein [Pseudobutyrivibrio xylanivorans]|uniref:ABC-2 type transport system ATP-binding protein n=1 Tax=Pseudobutyrivibrio xylanivorans DSM 14809 TaxID=1123012 RepID=A0A1M6DZM4_PSEXY|nr:ABC transporter ATP-binding protein [Pseudobutyrivibrio xylanivorans]SHI78712.1 ABC-2 type transport system ATP-binding protein [Pseudobutyrivibrio xylanivorans DSM 14809]